MSFKKFLRKTFLNISDEERFEIDEAKIKSKLLTVVDGVTKVNDRGKSI
ncbi:hypothetical protein AWH56_010755 [Anaerobacillus isosaccharinicus]|uniref:Uncharacterized protein n=1 Tax=Anaerobacillus isosaccharinicus TaxID=1532552 RepID=A0A7S7LBM9_9BACI|nr:hypothetical protein [Anaerobacillus isosaccharinicus]MBA5588591.1 hypothetical protein [Anaerobacillus isosaccharinicus]QOY37995.1 hypothetical protein AWH56_010755 [Anaerobacillus isosaccharinicus]